MTRGRSGRRDRDDAVDAGEREDPQFTKEENIKEARETNELPVRL
jgi:hypothetical protein